MPTLLTKSWADQLFFDEDTYLAQHPGVVPAVAAGAVKSGYDHYYRFGKWEGRAFPVRKRLLGTVLLALVLWTEGAVRRILAAIDPFELWPRLRDQGHKLVLVAGPRTLAEYRAGPWRATLLPWQRTRWLMAELLVEAQAAQVQWILQPADAQGRAVGEAFAVECASLRVAKRLVRLPDGATSIILKQPPEPRATRPLRLQLKPLSQARARAIMKRRLARTASNVADDDLDALFKSYSTTFPLASRPSYSEWISRIEAPQLGALDAEAPARVERFAAKPLVSILLPTYNTDADALRACLDSVLSQSYDGWELCVVDDASGVPHVVEILREYENRDSRIHVEVREERGHISKASQHALGMASGEFVALLDHDDVLCRHALLLMLEAALEHPAGRVFYSDEDKLDERGGRRAPHFKPDFDPDRLLGQNYISHLLMVRRDALERASGFRVGLEGSQDHDLVLRLTQGLTASEVVHVPWVLYHWREAPGSTAMQRGAKPYAIAAGLRAVREALREHERPASVDFDERGQCYRVSWELPSPPPLVSIIIPTRDGVELLSTCIHSILTKTDYPLFEILIIDNDSQLPQTHEFFKKATQDPRVRVLAYEHAFNFSAINNFAIEAARGSVVALVNNDIEVIDGAWLREMVAHATRPGVGCVGAKLLYPDGRIQHAGVVLGIGGVAGHAFKFAPGDDLGYFSKLCIPHTVSAVTAACLVVSKDKYEEVGGLDEHGLKVAFNDVDFCIKVRDAGYRNVMLPHVALIHHESATRGSDNDESRRDRFAAEQRVMHERHGNSLTSDPYYSPHLTLEHEDFGLRFRY